MIGKNVLVLGLGTSGLAMARWCVSQGANVRVADTRTNPPCLQALRDELPQVEFYAGAFSPDSWADKVYVSPGLSPKDVAGVADKARLGGELDLFAQGLKNAYAYTAASPIVLAVTGTNGKTTVTSLTAHLLEAADWSVAVAGNIGPSLLDTLSQRIKNDDLPQVWVLELSSFQLHSASEILSENFDPSAAVILNLSEDHLDWHGSMEAYAQAKERIFGRSTVRVRFSLDTPQHDGEFGLTTAGGFDWLAKKSKGETKDEIHLLMPAGALLIRGRHNVANALAALALVDAAGCPLEEVLHALREYRGEPHRVQSLGMVREVEYIDDSKGTNVGATLAALEGLGAERRLVVILGGLGKGQDFSPLAQPLVQYARAAVLIGQDAPLIRAALTNADTSSPFDIPLLDAANMSEAVALASAQAHSGDAVLLSPACASMDMFKSYEHRAQVFAACVEELKDGY